MKAIKENKQEEQIETLSQEIKAYLLKGEKHPRQADLKSPIVLSHSEVQLIGKLFEERYNLINSYMEEAREQEKSIKQLEQTMQDVLMEKDKNLQGITQNLIKEAEN